MDLLKCGQTELNLRKWYFFGGNPKSRSLNQVNLVCPLHCPIYNVLAHDYVQGVFCTFLCAHISTQIIFVCNCSHFCANIFEGTTYLRAIVRAHKSCAYADCRQIVNRTSVTSDSFSRLLYISLSPPEVVRAISYKVMLIKKSVRPILWTCQFTKDNFMDRHERRRYYVEILYTSVSRLCQRRWFVSWNFWFLEKLAWN